MFEISLCRVEPDGKKYVVIQDTLTIADHLGSKVKTWSFLPDGHWDEDLGECITAISYVIATKKPPLGPDGRPKLVSGTA